MVREIGSEFHKMLFGNGCGIRCAQTADSAFVFSGRTAIETILKNVPEAKKAILPSFCCDSMIEPFRQMGIKTCFYDVSYKDGLSVNMEIAADVDILLWCNYFGYRFPMPDLSDFLNRGGVIIEDVTHSLFSKRVYSSQSDYLVASLRKWEPVYCGGYCAAIKGTLKHKPVIKPPEGFITRKRSAMELKTQYLIKSDEEKKTMFLSMYGESNSWLAGNYSELTIDPWSFRFLSKVDIEQQRKIRRRNAEVLYKGLKNYVRFLFPWKDLDCPIFVPIILHGHRDEIRKDLTLNKIYCPIHWPHPNAECNSNLYDMELSLICDQRYLEEDMERIVAVLSALFR